MFVFTLFWLVSSMCYNTSASAIPCLGDNCARAAAPATGTAASTAAATPTTFVIQVIGGGKYNGQFVDVGYVSAQNRFAAIVEPGIDFAAYYTLSSANELLLSGYRSQQNNSNPHGGPVYFTEAAGFSPIHCYKIPNPLNATTPFLQCIGEKPNFVIIQACDNVSPIPYPAFLIQDTVAASCYPLQLKAIPKVNPCCGGG